MLKTCVTSTGKFKVGLHRPSYRVRNLRDQDFFLRLGSLPNEAAVVNQANFPPGDVEEQAGRWIYEIPNAFPFLGATYIDSGWAAARAADPSMIRIAPPPDCSLAQSLDLNDTERQSMISRLPLPLKYALAANSTDPAELVLLAKDCCRMEFDADGEPIGLRYLRPGKADIDDFELFETIANNPHLPSRWKEVMVLRPGVQGGSEIVGRFAQEETHVFEYLRRNSYIPWGHYAANMAHDAVRYCTADLSLTDMRGLRHLYYQRMIVVLAEQFGLRPELPQRSLTEDELESLRKQVLAAAQSGPHPATLWGWNFGYDFSGSGCRLHASHQMIHQQYALTPEMVETTDGKTMPAYSCGDQVAAVIAQYRQDCGGDFFRDYLRCIRENERPDRDSDKECSLIVHEDANVLLFVPKAQVSQWELQLMVIADADSQPVGNVLEADAAVRRSIDQGILLAQHVFAKLGARMVTSVEYSKRIGICNGQRLLYAFMPKLPWSMGSFSEAQHRYISSHFPEDFAAACRNRIKS